MKTRKIIVVIEFLLCLLFLIGCEKIDNECINNSYESLLYQDSTFLQIEGDLYDSEIIWANKEVYIKALRRMERHLFVSDNCLKWNFSSGEELKISDNIFSYITGVWKRQNERLMTKRYHIEITNDRYIVKINKDSLQTKVNDLNPEKGYIILISGDHYNNMGKLIELYNNINPRFGHLCQDVNLIKSDMRGNGMGDVSIKGSLDFVPRGGSGGYYCCNACAHYKDRYCCSKNYYSYKDWMEYTDATYNWIKNEDHLPLITLTNMKKFN